MASNTLQHTEFRVNGFINFLTMEQFSNNSDVTRRGVVTVFYRNNNIQTQIGNSLVDAKKVAPGLFRRLPYSAFGMASSYLAWDLAVARRWLTASQLMTFHHAAR